MAKPPNNNDSETRILAALDLLNETVARILRKVKKIMGNQDQATDALVALKAQLVKASTEIKAKIDALVAAAEGADVKPNLQAAIDDLKPVGQALDDIVPDEPTPG